MCFAMGRRARRANGVCRRRPSAGVSCLAPIGEHPNGSSGARASCLSTSRPGRMESHRDGMRIGCSWPSTWETGSPRGVDEGRRRIQAYNQHGPGRPTSVDWPRNRATATTGRGLLALGSRIHRGAGSGNRRDRASLVDPVGSRRPRSDCAPKPARARRVSDLLSEKARQELLEMVPHRADGKRGGAGHMVAGDRNDIFNDAVVTFLETCADDRRARNGFDEGWRVHGVRRAGEVLQRRGRTPPGRGRG